MTGDFKYYAIVDENCDAGDPLGVVRVRQGGDYPAEEAFTRNLRWEPSHLLLDIQSGRSYDEAEEITEGQAAAFVQRTTGRLRNNPALARMTNPDHPAGQ